MANCKVIAVTNQKGGVAKSIFAHDKNVAAAYRPLTKEVLELERKAERFRDNAAR